MSANQIRPNPDERQQDKRRVRDLPGCIKYIILLFLLLLLFGEFYAGEYKGFPRVSQLVLFIILLKILLIILLLILIWVQRQLFCDITSPVGCAIKEYDPVLHKWIVRVIGTASGTAFGNYTLNVTLGGGPSTITVIYPGGGSSGTSPVTNGELAKLDVTDITPDAYDVELTVNPSGWGSPCVISRAFTLLLKTVSITSVGGVAAQVMGAHPDDIGEILKEVNTLRLRLIRKRRLAPRSVSGERRTISAAGGRWWSTCCSTRKSRSRVNTPGRWMMPAVGLTSICRWSLAAQTARGPTTRFGER